MRVRAIWRALKFGLLPSRLYEDEPHYDCGYLAHLWMNLTYAWRWATWTETTGDRSFENGEDETKPEYSYREYKGTPPPSR